MKINTKFNVGDSVFYIQSNKVVETIVAAIFINIKVGTNSDVPQEVIKYHMKTGESNIHENMLFPSSEALATSIGDGSYNDRISGRSTGATVDN